jgi:Protein of unknown function (DUF3500)
MTDTDPTDHRRTLAEHMREAANRIVDSTDADQRQLLCWPFPSDDERQRWFYTPTDHGGLTLGHMTAPQHRRVHQLLSTALSTAGYVTAATILGLENVLDQLEGFTASWGHPRGRDPLRYYLRIFGEPSDTDPWSWRFGGHHISLHFTIVGGRVVGTTPLFLGADPASSPLLGPHPLRPLEGVEDLARELARSLDDRQRPRAIVTPRAPTDLVGVNRAVLHDGDEPLPLRDIWRGRLPDELDQLATRVQVAADAIAGLTRDDLVAMSYTATPKGLPAIDMSVAQREMLDTLLRRYADRLPDGVADDEVAKFSGTLLNDVHLLWAGGLEPGQPHYYRLHSPLVLAEYDNTTRNANHVHTVWRDPRGDFGADALARHHADHHHD